MLSGESMSGTKEGQVKGLPTRVEASESVSDQSAPQKFSGIVSSKQ